MNFIASAEKERELEKRIHRIVDLSRRRDCILEAPMLDLEALSVLAADPPHAVGVRGCTYDEHGHG
jgi:hypothetical protein